jgi:PKD repeat protein
VSNSTTQNPGNITFSSAGTYTVMLTVTDSLRLADPSPATRMVTVQSVAGGTPHSGITVADTDNNGYISVKEVTAKCLECHTDKAQQMFHSIHYQWTGRASNVSNISGNAGKNQGALNSYCGSIDTSPWYTCLNCHAGGGGHPMAPQDFAMLSPAAQPQELSNIDCLVCHQDSYVRAGRNAATAQTDPPYIDSQAVGQNGQPVTIQIPDENKPFEFVPFYDWRNNTQDVTALQNAVRNPHPTTRKGCLRCHAGAAGSNGGKRGDLANMTVSPTPTQDVHMSIERQLLWPAH